MLDMAFDEDHSRARSGCAAENLAVARHVAFNMIRLDRVTVCGMSRKKSMTWNAENLRLALLAAPRPFRIGCWMRQPYGGLTALDNRSSADTVAIWYNTSMSFLDGITATRKAELLGQFRAVWTHDSTVIEGNALLLDDTMFVLQYGLTTLDLANDADGQK